MLVPRSIGAALLAVGLLAGPVWADADGGMSVRTLQGVARDALGNVLEGVEVLVLSEITGLPPIAVVHSGDDGEFRVAGLSPGVYRVAAVKQGYRTYLGRINTALASPLELLLRTDDDASSADDARPARPESHDWILRLPRRSMLRETEQGALPEVVLAGGESDLAGVGTTLLDLLQLRLDQVFFLGESLRLGDTELLGVEGSETQMELATALGPHGSLALRGNRERVRRTLPGVDDESWASDDSSRFEVDLSYDTSSDENLAIRAFYAERGFEAAAGAGSLLQDLAQFHRAWGYDAAWSKQLDAASRLSLRLDYVGASTALSEVPFAPDRLPGEPAAGALSNLRVGAQGTYESVPLDRHTVRVGFRAQFAELPSRPFSAVAPFTTTPVVDGWSVRVNAEDSWSVATPVTLVYGLGYKHAMTGTDASLIVPRLGGVLATDAVSLKLLLSYHAVEGWGPDADEPGVAPFRPYDPVGYEATLEVPLHPALRLEGRVAYEPIQFDTALTDDLSSLVSPMFVTDGNAADNRATLAVAHQSERATTRLEVSQGEARGTLVAVPQFGTPLHYLSDNRLRYRNGRVGVRVLPSGTDLAVEYRRLEEAPLGLAPDEGMFVEESVELRLIQRLLRLRATGAWRLLLAIRVAEVEDAAPDGRQPGLLAAELSSANRLAAGMSVSF